MRPFGALVLGAYTDRHGRRAGLLMTLSLMSVGTLAIAIVPSYASIGLAAPLLILLSRLIQGFSAGAELGGVSVYLAEIATPDTRASTCPGSPAASRSRSSSRPSSASPSTPS